MKKITIFLISRLEFRKIVIFFDLIQAKKVIYDRASR